MALDALNFILRRRRKTQQVITEDETSGSECLQFDFRTIRVATDNFSNNKKIGQGGFSVIYKGTLPNGQEIAVKRLSRNSERKKKKRNSQLEELEFENEIMLMPKLQHRNLVRLIGFCLEGNERLLIYEFVPNSSLNRFIFDPSKRLLLDWATRYKIIGGIARGLLYLHEDSQLQIIHRDLKPSSILLDAEMNPKISDFGMARSLPMNETEYTDRSVGTYGYTPPEYAIFGQSSAKSDVFSFGVLVLEIINGQRTHFQNEEGSENLLTYAWRNWNEGTAFNLIDPILRVGSRSEMLRCINIGLLCVQDNVTDRPSMASVVFMLRSRSLSLAVPSKAAFLMDTTIWSDNDNFKAEDETSGSECLQFDYRTIRVATDNFSNNAKLGQGGFGIVYKGTLPNRQEIAVKRFCRNSGQEDLGFKNEAEFLPKLQHRNLIRLIGFCLEGNERLLIYEFVPNSSLDRFIFDPSMRLLLGWAMRYQMIGGIAQGLLYLHEDSGLRIIHGDLKPSNILIDAKMNPKISDFGMARLLPMDETERMTDKVVGTYGYMAPEYVMHGQFSAKIDVFSFGVLLLEIISGQKNSHFQNGEDSENFLTYAWRNWNEGTALNLIDPVLWVSSTSEMLRCFHIGLLCVQENATNRPGMASVVLMLRSRSLSLPVPSRPAFFIDTTTGPDNDNVIDTTTGSDNDNVISILSQFSINETSITELVPR